MPGAGVGAAGSILYMMHDVAERLVAEETRATRSSDASGPTNFRVCEKLRASLSTVVGTMGYRALVSRALALAKVEAPELLPLQVSREGALEFPPGFETHCDRRKSAAGEAVLTAQLLALLANFVGRALTLRLVQDIWPKAALENLKSNRE